MRTRNDKNRPLLQTDDPRARIQSIYDVRDPLYRQVADLVVDTGRQGIGVLLNHLMQNLEAV